MVKNTNNLETTDVLRSFMDCIIENNAELFCACCSPLPQFKLLERMCVCKNLRGDFIFLQQWSGLNIETFIAWNCFSDLLKLLKMAPGIPIPQPISFFQ